MASMSVSGIVSGMDWESMIDEIITNAAKPAQVKVNKKTNLTNKKSLFEEMKVTMNTLQSSLSALKLPSTYKAKTIDIERLDKNTSYKGVLTATANADASVNVWEVKVNKLATAQINRSKQITDSNLTSTLNGVSGKTIYIDAGGQKVGVEVKSSYTLESLKSRINTALTELDSPLYITASVVDNKLILKSDYTGKGTMTSKETVNYNYSTGINRLSNISIPSSAVDNVKITASGKSYVIHKDFEVANGNEIRWRQYDRGDEVALGDTVDVKYTMAAGDVYETSGTYNDGEAEISGFSFVNDGTLASRLKIKDEDNVYYEYGTDFTITNGKVVWLEDKGVKTNEPSSYTVSYDNTVSKNYRAEGTKTTPMKIPESYTVSYDKVLEGTVSSARTNDTVLDFQNPAFVSGNLPKYTEFTGKYGLSVSGGYLDFDSSNGVDKLEIVVDGNVSSAYSYGTDFRVRQANYGSDSPYYNQGTAAIEWRTESRPANGYTIRYTHSYSADTTNSTGISQLITEAGTETDKIKITGSDGTVYTNGVHFDVNNGEIVWKISDEVVDVTTSQFAELQTKYAEATGSELTTKTLIDRDGILRTYVDPEDTSLFTMSAGGKDYEYGRDYVLMVNDAGTGYRFDWLLDDGETITDANTTVATYAAYKNISTSSWTAAPADSTAYNFGFNYTYTTPASKTVNKTDTDKTVVFDGVTVSSSDYSKVAISSGSTTYTYGKDYVVNKSGEITWLDQNSATPAAYTANYKFSDNASVTMTIPTLNNNGVRSISASYGAIAINNLGTKTFTDSGYTYVDEVEGKAAFTLTDGDGNTYEYGKDYVVRYFTSNAGKKNLTIVSAKEGHDWPSSLTNRDSSTSMPKSGLTLTYNNTVSRTVISSETVEDALGFVPSNVSITDIDGNPYTEGTDYNINTTTGEVTWLNATSTTPSRPQETGKKYTLTYEAFALTGTGTYDSNSTTQDISLTDSYGGTAVAYDDILSYTGLTSSSDDSAFAKYFTLSDGTTTYTYGTDYKLVEGTTGSTAIEWLDGTNANHPSGAFTLTMAGLESISTTVKRSASDTLSVNYSDLDSGTVTITQGSKTFYEGVDFTIEPESSETDAKATVNWIPDSKDGYEWYYPNPGSTYTINHTDDDGKTTTYSATRTASDTLSMSTYGMTTAAGSISVQYGDGESYELDDDSGYDEIKDTYAIDITPITGDTFTFKWLTPTLTTHSNLPSMNEELTVELSYDANTFDLSDDSDGDLLEALGFVDSSGDYIDYTAADDAELEIDGQTVTVDSNDIGADYENEVIKGVTLHLKGTGTVSLDISHDAEKAVESIQTFVDSYNDLMTWINTRMSEKQVDEDTAATIDSDDFRMRWGLLHGNSLLRNTKSQMRSLVSQNFTFSFTERKSSSEVYGRMSYNGLKSSSTLRLRIGSKYVDVTIDPDDTLETIVAKINDDTKNGPMHNIYYDDDGNKLQTPLLKASVQNDKLVINSTSSDEITMSGSAAMNALKMNYTYKGLYQIGIETTSDDYGKSGELVFDTDEFMTALEDNPDEVQSLMLAFANQFNTWTRSMLNSSSSGEVSGTLTREIENIQTQIDSINEYLESYQDRLDRMEESLRTRYGNTETQFSKLSQQANSIAAILNQLNGNASGGGYGQTSS